VFGFKGGYEVGGWSSLDPMYRGAFRCSKEEVKIPQEQTIDLVKSGSTNVLNVRAVVAVIPDRSLLVLKQTSWEELGIEIMIEKKAEPEAGGNDG
jgi:hypothetical protein